MNRYVFLIGFMTGGDYGDTGIDNPSDLLREFLSGSDNEHLLSVEISGSSEEIAIIYGRAAAWEENFPAEDTFSEIFDLDELEEKHKRTFFADKTIKAI